MVCSDAMVAIPPLASSLPAAVGVGARAALAELVFRMVAALANAEPPGGLSRAPDRRDGRG
jgi:hypothetical protein